MYAWSDEHRAIAEAVRRFVDEEIRPVLDDLEFGDLAPYGILSNKYLDAFARTTRYDATITIEGDTFRYDETTTVEHAKSADLILHTDRNTMHRVSLEA